MVNRIGNQTGHCIPPTGVDSEALRGPGVKLAELLGSAGRAETVEDRGRAPCCSPESGAF